jgi:hypothetical protein
MIAAGLVEVEPGGCANCIGTQRAHAEKPIEGRITASQIAAASAASFFCRRIYGFT